MEVKGILDLRYANSTPVKVDAWEDPFKVAEQRLGIPRDDYAIVDLTPLYEDE